MSTTKITNILDNLGYIPITSDASQILYVSIKKALERNFDQQFATILVEKLCSMTGLTENELLTNYDLFEKSLYGLLDSKKFLEIVLHWVKIEMLTESVVKGSSITVEQILDPKLTINDILHYVSSEQVYEFIRKLPAHKYVTFFYRIEQSKDKALTAFFDPATKGKAPTSLISLTPIVDKNKETTISSNKNLNIDSNVLYTQIFSQVDKAEIKKRLYSWLYSVHASSKSKIAENGNAISEEEDRGLKNQRPATRIATDDDSWFFRNGFGEEIVATEESVGRCIKDNISCMCMYDIPNVTNEESLRRLIASHSHVIVDYPYLVYAAAGEAN